jgi:hypothetical protein
MNQLIISLFVVAAPIAIVACIVGTVGGHLFRDIDKKINSKLQGKRRR